MLQIATSADDDMCDRIESVRSVLYYTSNQQVTFASEGWQIGWLLRKHGRFSPACPPDVESGVGVRGNGG